MKVKLLKKLRRKAVKYVKKSYKIYDMKNGTYRIYWSWSEPCGEIGIIRHDFITLKTALDAHLFMSEKVRGYMKMYIRKNRPKRVKWYGSNAIFENWDVMCDKFCARIEYRKK